MSEKIIQLKENDLKKIIKDTVNETLNSYQECLMYNFENIYHVASIDNPLSYLMRNSTLNEGIVNSYPIDVTIRYLNNYFNKDKQRIFVRKANGLNKKNKITIDFPNSNNNFEVLNKTMNFCGYFLSFPTKENLLKDKNSWVIAEYEALHDKDDTIQIRNEEVALVHITPNYYLEKIKQQGFVPRDRNNLFSYPGRIYFLRASLNDDEILNFAWNLLITNKNQTHNGLYNFIWIDLNKVNKDVKFYLDGNLENSVFTMDNIKPDCICEIQEFDFKPYLKKLR